jgi:hypothetical protein
MTLGGVPSSKHGKDPSQSDIQELERPDADPLSYKYDHSSISVEPEKRAHLRYGIGSRNVK